MPKEQVNGILERALISGLKRSSLEIHRVDNLQKLKAVAGAIGVNITLCPLYIGKTIGDSDLLASGTSMAEMRQSRVYNKLMDCFACIQSIKENVNPIDTEIDVHFTFADTGIFLGHQPETKDEKSILHHLWLYRKAIRESAVMKDVHWNLTSYSKLNNKVMPKFLFQESANSTTQARRLFSELTRPALSIECFDHSIINKRTHLINKSGAAIIAALIDAFGHDTARALIIQYGFYDAITTGPHDLNLFFERGPLLLNLTNLFPHKKYPRVDILSH